MAVSLLVWGLVLLLALIAVRQQQTSLGLPLAYLTGLMLIHVPGGLVHWLNPGLFSTSAEVAQGLRLSALAAVAFLAGLLLSLQTAHRPAADRASRSRAQRPARIRRQRQTRLPFWRFCLIGGLSCAFLLTPLLAIPSLAAVVSTGSAIWILGSLLAIRCFSQQQRDQLPAWLLATLAYPSLTLMLGGFLSYGTAALINTLAVLLVSLRGIGKVLLAYALALVLALSVFTAYFQNRNNLRDAVWGGESLQQRITALTAIVADLHLFDPYAEADARATDERLNQNYFLGVAEHRLHSGSFSPLAGRSLWEAITALVPRMLWPDKPVSAGSGTLVAEATGLVLSETTSFGIGNVMEAYLNFGTTGILLFFSGFGYVLSRLDRSAFLAEQRGDIPLLLSTFLPAVALIQPNGSFVELSAAAAAAWLAARFWAWLWRQRSDRPLI